MTESAQRIELDFRADSADYYLIGDQIWYSSLFTHHTVSAIERDESGAAQHVLDLGRLEGSSSQADTLIGQTWEEAVFIGKLMTSGSQDEENLLKTREEKGRPHKEPEEIARLARKHASFDTALFVARPLWGYYKEDGDPEETEEDPARLIAGVHSNGSRSLRILTHGTEAHYYDEQYGDREATTGLSTDGWAAIDNFHRFMYDLASDEIAARRLGETDNAPLRMF